MTESNQRVAQFIAAAFSDNGAPSASRLLTIPHVIASIFVLVFVTIKNHVVPDATVLGGLGVFATIHYAVNKTGNAVESFSKK